jgi:NAD(P)H-dependent FMN reductase
MKILGISGSASRYSSNYHLLKAIQTYAEGEHIMSVYDLLPNFELFTPERLKNGVPQNILAFKTQVLDADAIIICTPEYTHNIPAVLKNMIEWCTASGEFSHKSILPITFTPIAPRGEFGMSSLLMSLQTMDAKVVSQLPLYKTDVIIEDEQIRLPKDIQDIIGAALELF